MKKSKPEKTSLLDQKYNQGTLEFQQAAKGVAATFLAVLVYTSSAVSVQLLQRSIPDLELNAIRFLVPLPFLCVRQLWTMQFPVIPVSDITGVVAYIINGFIMALAFYTGVSFLPIARVQSISASTTILSGALIFVLFLKDKPNALILFLILVCIIGVTMVIQPDFIFESEGDELGNVSVVSHVDLISQQEQQRYHEQQVQQLQQHQQQQQLQKQQIEKELQYQWLNSSFKTQANATEHTVSNHFISVLYILKHFLPVVSGTCISIHVLIVKKYPFIATQTSEVMFWYFLASLLASVIFMLILETPVLPIDWKDILIALLHGLFCGLGCPLYIYAAKQISGNTYNVIFSSNIVFQLVAQYTVLSSILPGHKNWMEVIGVVLVTMGSVLVSLIELQKSKLHSVAEKQT